MLGSTGGISFHPGSGIISDTGTLMFDKFDDSDDDDDEEDKRQREAIAQQKRDLEKAEEE